MFSLDFHKAGYIHTIAISIFGGMEQISADCNSMHPKRMCEKCKFIAWTSCCSLITYSQEFQFY